VLVKEMHRDFVSKIMVFGGVNAGTKERGFDRLWGWEAN